MFRRIAGVLIALACTCMTFGQTAQTKAQSIIGRTQSLIKQGTIATQNGAKQTITNSQRVIKPQGSTVQSTVNNQLPSYGQTISQQSNVQGVYNQNVQNVKGYQQSQQYYNQLQPIAQPTATTTPHETGTTAQSVTQNFQEFQPQNFQPQEFQQYQPQPQQQQYYYNNNSGNNWNRTQFQPVRRVWNFTRNIFN